jgi:hypothetical protein
MMSNNLSAVYPEVFKRIQEITWELTEVNHGLIYRSDQENIFDHDTINTVAENILILLQYWDCFAEDFTKENISQIHRETITSQVYRMARVLDQLEAATELLTKRRAKRELFMVNEWLLEVKKLLG